MIPLGSTLLIARYWIVPLGWRNSRRFSLQSVVLGSSATEPAPVMKLPAGAGNVRSPSWNLQSAVANASAFSELVPSVLRMISSENELPSSWRAQVHARRASQVVEPVTVLQVLQRQSGTRS